MAGDERKFALRTGQSAQARDVSRTFPTPGPRFPGLSFLSALIVAATVAVYCGSFSGPFVFDDVAAILENPTIRRLWPLGPVLSPPHELGLTVNGRPVLNFSLALNYAASGAAVWSYHALNLLIHSCAGLALFGVVRRTLGLDPGPATEGTERDANMTALAIALLWVVHPLQTAAVTYTVQRAESLAGLFYLLTLYAFLRSAGCQLIVDNRLEDGARGASGGECAGERAWLVGSAAACALGMATKETMVSAPVIVLLFDRTFVAGSFAEAWRQRWRYHGSLAATWLLHA